MNIDLSTRKEVEYKSPALIETSILKSKPFLDNKLAKLIHRVRYVTKYKNIESGDFHIAIEVWCGGNFNGDIKKFTFQDDPGNEKLVCLSCEKRAIHTGLKTSDEMAGRHVCQGNLKVINVCCTRKRKPR